MKRNKFLSGILALALVFGLILAGCDTDGGGSDDPALTGTVTITGTASVGATLTASVSGSNATTFKYQWKRGTTNIGTNSDTYVVAEADREKSITVVISADGYSGSKTSNAIAIPAGTAYTLKIKNSAGHDAPLAIYVGEGVGDKYDYTIASAPGTSGSGIKVKDGETETFTFTTAEPKFFLYANTDYTYPIADTGRTDPAQNLQNGLYELTSTFGGSSIFYWIEYKGAE
jgi:hypothetical protein